MKKVCNYFGIIIKEVGANQYVANVRGHEIKGVSPDDVKDKIIYWEREEKRNDVVDRLQKVGSGMSKSAAEFVVNMVAAHHSTEMAALMRIGDYLYAHGV